MKAVHRPLLNEASLQNLYRCAHPTPAHHDQRLLEQQQSGDVVSRYRGAGLDYEESRVYQAGDEPRFINWRLTARSGEPHVMQFREERRPGVFVLVDHRGPMRFGTRVRLKAAQASRAAALIAFAAEQQGWTVSGVCLQDEARWFPASTDSQGIWQFVRDCAGARPPLEGAEGPSLVALLPLLGTQLVRGTHVYLLSDFADLDEACVPHLLQLLGRHPVIAVHVLDPAEQALPDAGQLLLQGMDGQGTREVDSSDPALREAFRRQAGARQTAIDQRLSSLGCEYIRLMTDVEAVQRRIPLPHGMGT